MDSEVKAVFDRLHKYMFASVYSNEYAKHEERKVPAFMEFLYEYFSRHPNEMPVENRRTADTEGVQTAVCDYLAGMTDRYATDKFRELFIPKPRF